MEKVKGDQRILGESDFVSDILSQADEKFERSYELKYRGYDLKTVVDRVCDAKRRKAGKATGS